MFTGIVEELGEIVAREEAGDGARLAVRGPVVTSDVAPGDSVAVNGVCLTVAGLDGAVFTVDAIGETLRRSSLGRAAAGTRVNLERAARLGDRLDGHLVQGHVDGTGTVAARTGSGDWELVRVSIPPRLSRYTVEKGSITVDGVSLTVIDAAHDEFSVGLIPTTRERTTLGLCGVGDVVNLEVDIVAKYVERLSGAHLAAGAGLRGHNAGKEA